MQKDFQDSHNNIYLSYSYGRELIRIDTLNRVSTLKYPFEILGRIDLVWEDSENGHICAVGNVGYDLTEQKVLFRHFSPINSYYKRGFRDEQGNLYFSTYDRIYRFKDSLEQILPPGQIKMITTLVSHGQDSIWVGTEQNGVYRLAMDGNRAKVSEHLLKDKKITHIARDNYQNLWFTSIGEGAYSLSTVKLQNFTSAHGLSEGPLNCLALSPSGVLWIGHPLGKTSLYNGGFLPPFSYDSSHPRGKTHIIKFLPDSTQVIGRDGVTLFRHPRRPLKYLKLQARGFAELSPGEYLVATSHVLRFKLDSLKEIAASNNQLLNRVFPARTHCILKHSDGNYYLGTNRGLWVSDGYKVWKPKWDHPILEHRIADLKEGKNGDIWMATAGWGAALIRKDSVFHFDSRYGLSGDNLSSIWVDHEGIIWIGSSTGLNKLSPGANQNEFSMEIFREEDGLLSSEVSDVLRENDSVWIATDKGLSLLLMDEGRNNPPRPSVYLHEFLVGDSSCLYEADKDFSPRQNRIRIRFDGVALSGARVFNYQYQLLGPMNR